MQPHVREVDEASFETEVIEASRSHPVLADFWASWCGPCRTLGPMLEALAGEHAGAFTLAKIDADVNGALAARFGVRGLPTVKVFRNAEVVDEFVGALPEAELRAFIGKHLEGPADRLLTEALELAQGNPEAGIELLNRGIELEPDKHQLRLALARLYVEQDRIDDAQAVLRGLPPNLSTSEEAMQIAAQIKVAGLSGEGVDESDPQSPKFKQAIEYLHAHRYEAALEQLAAILEVDPQWQDGRARQLMIDVFALPDIEPNVTARWRRRLAAMLN